MDAIFAELEGLLNPKYSAPEPKPVQSAKTEVVATAQDPVIVEAVRVAVEAERARMLETVREVAKTLAAASEAVHDLEVAYAALTEKLFEGEDDAQVPEEA